MKTAIYGNIAEYIGNTPVVELHDSLIPEHKRLFVKLEYYNPSFSIKDRTALGLVKAAIAAGKLKKGGTLIESTSGNLGKSLALLGAVYGFHVIVVVDAKTSSTVIRWCEAYGAQIEVVRETDENGGYQKTRVARVQKLLKEYPGAVWPNQYDNEANPAFHYSTTGEEVAELPVDTVVGTVSTGGHLCGVSRKVKEKRPATTVVACDVEGSAVFDGVFRPYLVNGSGLSWRSKNTDLSVLDKLCILSDQEAISICHLMAREHGLLFGGSAGLVMFGSLAWLIQSTAQSAVAIIPDTGANYLDQIYSSEWLAEKGIKLLTRSQLAECLETRRVTDMQRPDTEKPAASRAVAI
ncbi:MAG TPA: pyridoxal-phosphate dependent enzyme [Candidatus Angelobacter sp.]|jgi:2,3-diaminopropionate biosynthesis protein SbnA|nr:pyridoxal-phosphate dependent enzyme [Candidatus Angelobacter sp.]